MRMRKNSVLTVAMAAFAVACSDPMVPTRALVSGTVSAAVTPHPIDFSLGGVYPPNLADGVLRLCKVANATGSFAFTWSLNGAQPVAIPGGDLIVTTPGVPACRTIYTSQAVNGTDFETVVITEAADQTNWALTGRDVDQYFGAHVVYAAPRLDDEDDTGARSVTVYLTDDLAKLVTFTNTFTSPPVEEICDFVTFGRLVTEVGATKVVISGNVGGLNLDASIKNEFHVDVNGIDYHVADAFTYGPIASGPLSGASFPNSRMATGTAKNGVAVELRVWDGGEPGKGTDWVYVKIGTPGTEPLGAAGKTIDQGNMQYHPNCRGPGDGTSVSTTSNGKKKG